VALLVLSLGVFAWRCTGDPAIPFVVQDARAPWIGYPLPPAGVVTSALLDDLPTTVFVRVFESPASGEGRLRIRALRRFEVHLNGKPVPAPPAPRHWKEYVELPVQLAAGANTLAVSVVNPTGPGLLSLVLEEAPTPLQSDARFVVSTLALPTRGARLLGGAAANPNSFTMPSPREGLAARGVLPAAGFALAALIFVALRGERGREWAPFARRALPGLIALLWLALLVKAVAIPLRVGFDAHHHVDYVEYLLERGHLPLASDGWSMFHPPLYYAPTAALVAAQRWLAPEAETLLAWRLVGWAAGLGTALLCGALAVRLMGRSRESALAAGFAALLPMNLYISSYLTNESLAATACTALILATVALLLRARTRPRDVLLWAGLAALALLTKYTAWLVAGVAGCFLLVAWARNERLPARRLARNGALALAVVAAVAGWFYVRNLIHLGQLFPLNTDLPGATQAWWQQPGYYTPAFFLHFGDALRHPFLSGFHTAWDSFYATLWGDGQLAGQVTARLRHPYWDWDLMAAGYALALPASAAVLLGVGLSLRRALHAPEAGTRAAYSFLLTLSWALLLSVLYMTLRQPDYGPAKSFYALAGIGPLSIYFATGLGALDRWLEQHGLTWARTLQWGWLGATAMTFALSYTT
jgi:hypothetical protein